MKVEINISNFSLKYDQHNCKLLALYLLCLLRKRNLKTHYVGDDYQTQKNSHIHTRVYSTRFLDLL